MRLLLLILISALLTACTQGELSNLTSIGSPAHVTCYSGGQVIYDGISTGKVTTVTNSDGWQFRERGSGKFIRVSGPCVIVN